MQPKTQQTHIVIKLQDAQRYLTTEEYITLGAILEKISSGRKQNHKSDNQYLICNLDEPYAQEVHQIILKGESQK